MIIDEVASWPAQFADPYLACEQDGCGAQVTYRTGVHNQPCGHHASFESTCPSWGPVDGCRCPEHLGAPRCVIPPTA